MMKHWLFKTDPRDYSFLNLLSEKEKKWNKATNTIEKKGIRNIQIGDLIAFYHGGDENKIVGTAEAVSDPYREEDVEGSKLVVDIKPVKQLEKPVQLWELKINPKFRDFDLLNVSELNICSINDEQWEEILLIVKEKVQSV